MNKELMESMNILEKEYNISKDTLLEAIENSLLTACKNHFGKADNVKVIIDPDGCDYSVYMEKEVVETVEDPITQISLADARMIAPRHVLGDIVQIPIDSHDFGRKRSLRVLSSVISAAMSASISERSMRSFRKLSR